MYLHALPTSKKCVPELITDPIALIRDVRTVVEKHRYDKAELAVTSKPVLEWWSRVSVCMFACIECFVLFSSHIPLPFHLNGVIDYVLEE